VREADVSTRLVQATLGVHESDLPRLALSAQSLPGRYESYTQVREDDLDNFKMAEHGFPGATEERFMEIGRINGFVREFWSSTVDSDVDGADVLVGSVAHLFNTPDGVHGWMHDVFLYDFLNNIGTDAGEGQVLVGADRFTPEGFFDEAVGLRASYNRNGQPITATIIDFRVGRILGVAYIATTGDHARIEEVTDLAMKMEESVVGVVLGG
jgi:hypothetical protein